MQTPRSRIERLGDLMVDAFHSVALFVIGATVIWSAIYEYLHIMHKGYAELKDILLLFIFLELGAMVGIYFKTHRLPVQFLIYVAITALARHLVIDVQQVSDAFHLYLLMSIAGAILVLSLAVLVLTYSVCRLGQAEDDGQG